MGRVRPMLKAIVIALINAKGDSISGVSPGTLKSCPSPPQTNPLFGDRQGGVADRAGDVALSHQVW